MYFFGNIRCYTALLAMHGELNGFFFRLFPNFNLRGAEVLPEVLNQLSVQGWVGREGERAVIRDIHAIWKKTQAITSNDRHYDCPILYTDTNSQCYFVRRHLDTAMLIR